MIKNANKAVSENRLLDAAIYYRATEFYTFKGDDPGKEYYYDKFIELFYKAIEDDEINIIKVPYNSIDLPVMRLTPKKEKRE